MSNESLVRINLVALRLELQAYEVGSCRAAKNAQSWCVLQNHRRKYSYSCPFFMRGHVIFSPAGTTRSLLPTFAAKLQIPVFSAAKDGYDKTTDE